MDQTGEPCTVRGMPSSTLKCIPTQQPRIACAMVHVYLILTLSQRLPIKRHHEVCN